MIDVNDHLLNLLLYHSKEEFLNDIQNQWINCIHKNDVYHVIETFQKTSSLERHQLEYRIRRKDHVIYGSTIKDIYF
ncbi:MAG: PAS domain-containing protein [Faecalibacillus faecis]